MKGSSPPLFQSTDYQRYIHYGLIFRISAETSRIIALAEIQYRLSGNVVTLKRN